MTTLRSLSSLMIGLGAMALLWGCSRPSVEPSGDGMNPAPPGRERGAPGPQTEDPEIQNQAAKGPGAAETFSESEGVKPAPAADVPSPQPEGSAGSIPSPKPVEKPAQASPPSLKQAKEGPAKETLSGPQSKKSESEKPPPKATPAVSPAPQIEKPQPASVASRQQPARVKGPVGPPSTPEKKPESVAASKVKPQNRAALSRAPAPSPATPAPLVVQGKVLLASQVPEPGTVPYTKCLTFIKYQVLSVERGDYPQSELLAVHWGMKENQLTPAARYKVGERHRLQLEPFNDHPELARVMQADDTNEYELTPYWVR